MSTKKLKGVLVKLLLVLIGCGLGILTLEFALRIFRPSQGTTFSSVDDIRHTLLNNPQDSKDAPSDPVVRSANLRSIIDPNPDNHIIYELKPNLDLIFQDVAVQTNSCGLRGPEIEQPKPINRYRIAILGDSFTFGWGVKQEDTFVARLQVELNQRSKGNIEFEVLNFGVPGYSTFQETYAFLEKGLELQPDFVLVFFIQNDFGLPFFVRDVTKETGFLAATELGRLTAKAIDPRWEEHSAEIAGLDPNRSLSLLSDKLRDQGIPLAITFNTRKDWVNDRKRLWVLRERREIKLFDMYTDFERFIQFRKIDKKTLVLSNDPHPSPLRHHIWGAQLASFFLDQAMNLNTVHQK